MWLFKNKHVHLILFAGLLTYLLIEAQGEEDLFIYFCAAHDLGQGADIYTTTYVGGFHYYYSVLLAYFLNLFSHLPFYGIKFSWLLLNVILFSHLFILLRDSKFVQALKEKQRDYFLLFVLIFSFRFFHQNIHFAQVTILILWTCIYSLISFENGNTLKGAAILALGINIKLLPLVFIPYLIYRGYWKGLFLTILFCILYVFLPSLLIGHHYNLSLLSAWYHLINPSNKEHILDTYERSFHGLSTLLSTLFVSHPPDPYALALKRNIADVPIETLKVILLLVRACLLSLTLVFLKWPPFKKAVSSQQSFIEVAYILLVIPLIFPHQQHYAFLFSVPAFAFIVYYLFFFYNIISLLEKRILVFLVIAIYLTANLSVLLGEFNKYYEHYKILTYGALLVIPLLLWINLKIQSRALGTTQKN
jgi:hypothetical protein